MTKTIFKKCSNDFEKKVCENKTTSSTKGIMINVVKIIFSEINYFQRGLLNFTYNIEIDKCILIWGSAENFPGGFKSWRQIMISIFFFFVSL